MPMPAPRPTPPHPRCLAVAALLLASGLAGAGEVAVVHAELVRDGERWRAAVTLRHADSGWDHYADGWRIVTPDGHELVTRKLHHPHVDEQPFTRSGDAFELPAGTTRVVVEAHDSVHGWSPDRLPVDLEREHGARYRVRR